MLFQGFHVRNVVIHAGRSNLTGFGKGSDLRHGFRAGTPPVLLTSAGNKRFQPKPVPDVKCTDAFRRMNFMSADADKISTEIFCLEGHLHKSLYGIRMKKSLGTGFFQRPGDGMNICDGAGFIVDHHKRDKNRVFPQRIQNGRDGDCAFFIRCQACDLIA